MENTNLKIDKKVKYRTLRLKLRDRDTLKTEMKDTIQKIDINNIKDIEKMNTLNKLM